MTCGQLPLSKNGELNQATFDDFITRLKHHVAGGGVNDHCTADAIFIVEKRVIETGYDKEYCEDFILVVDHYDNPILLKDYCDRIDEDEKTELNKIAKEYFGKKWDSLDDVDKYIVLEETDYVNVTGYRERWEHVNCHFTKEAAEAFIERKKHDYRDGLRVYVDSQYWCWEFKAIQKAFIEGKLVLMNTPANQEQKS